MALTGQQVFDILKHKCGSLVQMAFTDVYSVDEINLDEILRRVYKQKRIPTACVINTAESTESKGEHYVAMAYIPGSSYGKAPHCYYFDSYGFGPIQPGTYELMRKLTGNRDMKGMEYNQTSLQDLNDPKSKACGYYVIFFIWAVCNSWTLEQVVKTFNTDKNDFLAKQLVKSIIIDNSTSRRFYPIM